MFDAKLGALIRSRRGALRGFALAGAALWTPGAFAEELVRTPAQTEGPFYPDKLPLDTDNDLLVVNDALTPAVGAITHLSGRVLSASGTPVRNALVEIWQVDNQGAYLHSRGVPNAAGGEKGKGKKRPEPRPDGDPAAGKAPAGGGRDRNFQGFGRFLTGRAGEYYFRTIKPVPYPGRTPHIHVKVKVKGQKDFTTQCYVKGEPRNDRDGILRSIRDPKQHENVVVEFAPVPGSRIGELAATFTIVLGFTPEA